MAINMQGSWTIAVKSAETFEPPMRFVVSDVPIAVTIFK